MSERRTARCSFICFRRFLSTVMCVILCVSASSVFLQTLGFLLLFFLPCTATEFCLRPMLSGSLASRFRVLIAQLSNVGWSIMPCRSHWSRLLTGEVNSFLFSCVEFLVLVCTDLSHVAITSLKFH